MKKIILTESQFERLRILNENTDIIAKFEAYCNDKIKVLNTLYSKVTNISVIEIIESKVNIDGMSAYLSKMENDLYTANKNAYSIINNLPEDDLDIKLDRAMDKVTDKISSIELILVSLEQIQKYEHEHKISEPFKDVQPIDISNQQN